MSDSPGPSNESPFGFAGQPGLTPLSPPPSRPGPGHTPAIGAPGFSGRPMMGSPGVPTVPAWPEHHAQPTRSSGKGVLLGVAIAGLVFGGIGWALTRGGPNKAEAKVPPVQTFMSTQAQMMREAMDMAREAQKAQREHMALMRAAMEESYGDGQPVAENDYGLGPK